jgi:protein phosphatase
MDRALREANRAIFERTARESDKQGMGTTASVLVLAGAGYLIGQVGDSRVYRLRDARLEQLTRDHSYVQEQVDAGLLTPRAGQVPPLQQRDHPLRGGQPAVRARRVRGDVPRGRRLPPGERRASPAWSTTGAAAAPRLPRARRPAGWSTR